MHDSSASESNFTLHNNNSSVKVVPSVLDEDSEKNSNITSNLDSTVFSYMHNAPVRKGEKIDMNLLNAQVNADQYSTEHL